ncbi:MAG: head-tail connector protein [Gammaproteobacteria bacterium]
MIKSDLYALEVIDAPDSEPVTLQEAIAYLREDENIAQTDLIESLIISARVNAEIYLQRALLTTQYTMYLDRFGDPCEQISLPRSTVISVDAIRYLDDAGVQQTLSSSLYRAETKTLRGRITPAYGQTWPTVRPVTNAVEIDFTAGYGEAADVPEAIKTAIKYMVYHWYQNRVPVITGSIAQKIPLTAEQLLSPYRARG